MNTLIFLAVCGGIIGVEVWAYLRIGRPTTRPLVRRSYWLLFVIAILASYGSTFHYEHMPNPNTRFVGWPVPRVVFQRDPPDGPWLDFVGITMLIAWPMNFIVFVLLPSIVMLPLTRIRKQPLPT